MQEINEDKLQTMKDINHDKLEYLKTINQNPKNANTKQYSREELNSMFDDIKNIEVSNMTLRCQFDLI